MARWHAGVQREHKGRCALAQPVKMPLSEMRGAYDPSRIYRLLILMRSIIIKNMMKPIVKSPDVVAARAETARPLLVAQGLLRLCKALPLTLGLLLSASIYADEPSIQVKIRNHQFIPTEVEIPAGEKRLLVIDNQDPTVEEFESHSLHREKIIPPNEKASVYVGPLKPGRYEFQGEFNSATAKGALVAK